MKYLNAKNISIKTEVTRFIDIYKQLKHLKFKSKKKLIHFENKNNI